MAKILQNAVMLKDSGLILKSNHVHDFVSTTTKDGKIIFVDGGTEYIRRSVYNSDEVEDLTIYDDEDIENISQKLVWGTNGKSGKEELKYVKLCNCEDDHLENILKLFSEKNVNPENIYIRTINYILFNRKSERIKQ